MARKLISGFLRPKNVMLRPEKIQAWTFGCKQFCLGTITTSLRDKRPALKNFGLLTKDIFSDHSILAVRVVNDSVRKMTESIRS